ncbi:FMN-binding glutamate synthase family protein [Flammeovirga pectinis]|uniref:FMN-binding glutamate synthase family protein n=1 Tax=Flammeovirga pectinis TaxID=2494373 RepID=A0A3Q9FLE0_9BACT|nr:FMN-binding glutamate synthase family protein [Flammeovirga pectinis]AZQ60878.1 FMN-binding glutamate synthase family protein [Flammeovirga pectinis]
MIRTTYIIVSFILFPIFILAYDYLPDQTVAITILMTLLLIGWYDVFQKKNAILRDYPIVGHFRYIFKAIAPELQQYFIERNTDGKPFNKNEISLIKSRSENQEKFHPFGTELDFYADKVQWLGHAFIPGKKMAEPPRIKVGGEHCLKPYNAALLNVSAMSFGSLSANAITALNSGARKGGFYHNTGEGGITPFHQQGGDIVLQIGTGNFGFRNNDGSFNDEAFVKKGTLKEVKMIEIKLSQGAKPGHGGVLPAAKNTEEIARIRLVKPHTNILSPPVNPEIKEVGDIPKFVKRVRALSEGKPVGFKLCIGIKAEFIKLIDTCIEQGNLPDFITVDAAEGGTGAAPLEYSDHIGMKGDEALKFVVQVLKEKNVREQVKVIYAGKVMDGFSLFKALCFGADFCNSARGFMFSLGCIQSLRCHTDTCPTGIATQNKSLQKGLDPTLKSERVFHYQENTLKSFLEILSTSGCNALSDLKPELIQD